MTSFNVSGLIWSNLDASPGGSCCSPCFQAMESRVPGTALHPSSQAWYTLPGRCDTDGGPSRLWCDLHTWSHRTGSAGHQTAPGNQRQSGSCFARWLPVVFSWGHMCLDFQLRLQAVAFVILCTGIKLKQKHVPSDWPPGSYRGRW